MFIFKHMTKMSFRQDVLQVGDACLCHPIDLNRMQISMIWSKYKWVYPHRIANIENHMYKK